MPDWTLMEFEDIKGIFIKLIPKLLWIKEFSFMKWNSAMHFRLKVNRELAYQYKANVCNSQEFIAFIYETFVSPLLRKVFLILLMSGGTDPRASALSFNSPPRVYKEEVGDSVLLLCKVNNLGKWINVWNKQTILMPSPFQNVNLHYLVNVTSEFS